MNIWQIYHGILVLGRTVVWLSPLTAEGLDLSVWGLHVLHVPLWVFSRYWGSLHKHFMSEWLVILHRLKSVGCLSLSWSCGALMPVQDVLCTSPYDGSNSSFIPNRMNGTWKMNEYSSPSRPLALCSSALQTCLCILVIKSFVDNLLKCFFPGTLKLEHTETVAIPLTWKLEHVAMCTLQTHK